MGRSIETPSRAAAVVYFPLDPEGDGDFGQLEDDGLIESVVETLQRKFPSFSPTDDRWYGYALLPPNLRETVAIAVNDHAVVCLSESGGLVAVSLIPADSDDEQVGLHEAWCKQVARTFTETLNRTFNGLRRTGTMSNGVSVYEPVA